MDRGIERAARLWAGARLAIAVTGAGISVASGVPDFRSPGGLWTRHDPDEVASVGALRTNPGKVWEFLLDAARTMGAARPNPAHLALAALERAGLLAAVVTQNIDGLHQAAGSQRVVEFHGSLGRYYCLGCGADHDPVRARGLTPAELPWRCASCGGVVRPTIVFFGEGIPEDAREEAFDLAGAADLVLVAGTSGEVAPANRIPLMVKNRGGAVVEINLGESAYGEVSDVRITARVEEALPLLAQALIPGGWTAGNPGLA
jgi:NAD-dependent deacetylase